MALGSLYCLATEVGLCNAKQAFLCRKEVARGAGKMRSSYGFLPASHVMPRSLLLHVTLLLLFLLLNHSPKLNSQLAGNGLHLQPCSSLGVYSTPIILFCRTPCVPENARKEKVQSAVCGTRSSDLQHFFFKSQWRILRNLINKCSPIQCCHPLLRTLCVVEHLRQDSVLARRFVRFARVSSYVAGEISVTIFAALRRFPMCLSLFHDSRFHY